MSEVGVPLREAAVPEVTFFRDEYTITSGMAFTINHGLAKAPKKVWLGLKNTTAELGYAVGDTVELSDSAQACAAYNLTQIKVVFATLPTIVNYSSQAVTAITAGSWNLVVKAEVA